MAIVRLLFQTDNQSQASDKQTNKYENKNPDKHTPVNIPICSPSNLYISIKSVLKKKNYKIFFFTVVLCWPWQVWTMKNMNFCSCQEPDMCDGRAGESESLTLDNSTAVSVILPISKSYLIITTTLLSYLYGWLPLWSIDDCFVRNTRHSSSFST